MSEKKALQGLKNLDQALQRLEEAVQRKAEDQLLIDGTIQRFEFTFELFWKTLKRMLELEGIETNTPRETLQKAYQVKWLNDEQLWLQMLKDRNTTSHTYDEALAHEIYRNIKKYVPEMRKIFHFLRTKIH